MSMAWQAPLFQDLGFQCWLCSLHKVPSLCDFDGHRPSKEARLLVAHLKLALPRGDRLTVSCPSFSDASHTLYLPGPFLGVASKIPSLLRWCCLGTEVLEAPAF